ncbi:MAG: single-stranded DNA-binding protein [Ginsengibacter sp.]
MIKLQIIGNLGGDCTQNEVSGKTVINFNVAHSEKFKDSTGNLVTRTTWVRCAYWTDRPAIVPYLKKGQLVYAEGSPEADGYLSKENQPAATLKMRVRNIQLLGGKTDDSPSDNSNPGYSSSTSSSNDYQQHAQVAVEEPADDLPF